VTTKKTKKKTGMMKRRRTAPKKPAAKTGRTLSGKVTNVEIIADDPHDGSPPDPATLPDDRKTLCSVCKVVGTLSEMRFHFTCQKCQGKEESAGSIEMQPSGYCFYGVLMPVVPTVALEDVAIQYGIKLVSLGIDPVLWFASVRDLACVSVTLTRDVIALDHQKRLRDFCKKTGVPFRAQWVFST